MRLLLASNNQKKLREMRALLDGLPVEIISQREAGLDFEAEETGETYEENARIKAEAAMKASGLPSLADDSGLSVAALDGAPGVHSARYTGRHDDSDSDRYGLLLRNLTGERNREASFISCVCCVFPDGSSIETRGECPGRILETPRGDGGFGYDHVFEPSAAPGRSMAELTEAEKNAISHRGRALTAFRDSLIERLKEKTC